jgi:hypothetical protein
VPALSGLWDSITQRPVPCIEEGLGPLSAREAEFVRAAEASGLARHMGPYGYRGNGQRPHGRLALPLAFLAKAVWNVPATAALVGLLRQAAVPRRPCGWEGASDVPSESAFSRAFRAFAEGGLPGAVHGAMVSGHMGGAPIRHAGLDSTAIEAREAPAPKVPEPPKEPRRPGRPRRGAPPRPPRRLDAQGGRGLAENVADLPARCARGAKRSPRGQMWTWRGYKLHLAVADGGAPVASCLTSASTHDSRAAIPLMQMAGGRVAHAYDIADSAYGAGRIRGYSLARGRAPIIARNGRGKEVPPTGPGEEARFKERTSVERAFAWLKDRYGGRTVRVRGAAKVMCHLMFGVVALAAARLFALLG